MFISRTPEPDDLPRGAKAVVKATSFQWYATVNDSSCVLRFAGSGARAVAYWRNRDGKWTLDSAWTFTPADGLHRVKVNELKEFIK